MNKKIDLSSLTNLKWNGFGTENNQYKQKNVFDSFVNNTIETFDDIADDIEDFGDDVVDVIETGIDKTGEWFEDTCAFVSEKTNSILETTEKTLDSVNLWWDITAQPAINEMTSNVIELYNTTSATIDAAGFSFLEGVAIFGEHLTDFGTTLKTAEKSMITGTYDSLLYIYSTITKKEVDYITPELWEETRKDIEIQKVKKAFDDFYNGTNYGQYIATNAYCFDDIRLIGNEIGYTSGVVALTVFTGGLAGAPLSTTGSVVTLASSTGKGMEEAYNDGASTKEGLLYGLEKGLWDSLLVLVGDKLNQFNPSTKVKGKLLTFLSQPLGNKKLKVLDCLTHMAFKGVTSSGDDAIEAFLKAMYKDSYIDKETQEEIKFTKKDNLIERYVKLFDEKGGYQNILTNAVIGSGVSLVGETVDFVEIFSGGGFTQSETEAVEMIGDELINTSAKTVDKIFEDEPIEVNAN